MSENLAIQTRGLTKIYGSGHTEVVAMRDATVDIQRGQVVALLGPSGAGKSTFLTAVGLINPPTSGQILIGGVPILDGPIPLVSLRRFRRQHIGYVFQKSNLIPFLFTDWKWLFRSLLPNGRHDSDTSKDSDDEAQIVGPARVADFVDADMAVEKADDESDNNNQPVP